MCSGKLLSLYRPQEEVGQAHNHTFVYAIYFLSISKESRIYQCLVRLILVLLMFLDYLLLLLIKILIFLL